MPTATGTARIFFALTPTAQVREAITAHKALWTWPAGGTGRMVAPDDWHVTLHFIGSVPRATVSELQQQSVVPLQPFVLRFDSPEFWKPDLAVLCASQIPEGLVSLHQTLLGFLHGMNLVASSAKLRPHITLARRVSEALPPATFSEIEWPAFDYALMESVRTGPPCFRVLRRYGPG